MDIFARDVTFAALQTGQRALSKRSELIAQNIANVNTPNYKRRDVDFVAELSQALEGGANRAERVEQVLDVTAREVVEERLFYRPDMGGVDLDREMAELAKTTMLQAANAQLISRRIRTYRQVIRDGRI